MIERFAMPYLDDVMRIWLEANASVHAFVEKTYWENAYDAVREALPAADLWLYREDGTVKGFVGLTAGDYIAGLFVGGGYRSQGIGRKLLEHCKARCPRLELDVFVENDGAVRFYRNQGFVITETKWNHEVRHREHHMVWPG